MIPVVFITSEKGGVGKSFFAMATIEAVLKRGLNVGLIEFDSAHPDVWQRYETISNVQVTELATVDGVLGQLDVESFREALEVAYSRNPDIIIANTPSSAVNVLGEAFKILPPENSASGFAVFYIFAEPFNDRTWSSWLSDQLAYVPTSQLFTIIPRWTLPHLRATNASDLQSQIEAVLPRDTTVAVVKSFPTRDGRVPWNAPNRAYDTLQDLIAEGEKAPMPLLPAYGNAHYLKQVIAQVGEWLDAILVTSQHDATVLDGVEAFDEAF